jgi:6-pyruvoyltetrahydropterin/6-carboxytetrahydropterin synthase
MVIDFSDIARILNEEVHDVVDHCTVLWKEDSLITECNLSKEDCGGRLLIVDFIPTAENFAKWAYDRLKAPIESVHPTLCLESVSVRETPKSIASYPSIL